MFIRWFFAGVLMIGICGFTGCGGPTEEGLNPPVDPQDDDTIPQNPPEGGMVPE